MAHHGGSGLECVSVATSAGTRIRDPLPIGIRMLGTFDLWFGERRVERWRAGKALSVLQYLLAHHDRPVSRSRLMDIMWPDGNSPHNSLKVAVHALRSILSGWEEAAERDSVLELRSHEHGYVLRTHNVWLDLAQFENVMHTALTTEQRAGIKQALPLYREATDLYRGEFLCGKSEQWVVVRREQLKDLYLQGLTRLMDDEIDRGGYVAALRHGLAMLEVDACRESTYQAIMVCHGGLGQPGRVMRWYEVCRDVLRTELNVEPQEATKRILARSLHTARSSA